MLLGCENGREHGLESHLGKKILKAKTEKVGQNAFLGPKTSILRLSDQRVWKLVEYGVDKLKSFFIVRPASTGVGARQNSYGESPSPLRLHGSKIRHPPA